MSLDLSSKSGVAKMAFASAKTDNLSTLADGDFTAGSDVTDAKKFKVFVDATAGDITLTPSTTVTGLEAGDVLTVIKADTSSNKLLFADPDTGATINYVNRQFESYDLEFDGSAWAFDH